MRVRDLIDRILRRGKKRAIEERITLGLVSESEAAILPAHQKLLYDKWKTRRESKTHA